MPSENMLYYKLPLYPEQAAEIEKIVSTAKVKTAKLFRAAVMLVVSDEELLQEAIIRSGETTYRKTGANAGKWKAYIRERESKHAKEKLQAQVHEEDDGEY